MDVIGTDVSEAGVSPGQRSGPRGGNHGRPCWYPGVGTGTDSPRNPTRASLENHLVYRSPTDSEEYVVMHFQTFNAFESFDGGTDLALPQDEGVIDKAITSFCLSGAVTANSCHATALCRDVLEDVSDNV